MNTAYRNILSEYLVWLDTLGYSADVIYSCRINTQEFLQWLDQKQVQSINLLTNKHISQYHAYLESRPNKVFKGRLLSPSHLNKSFIAVDKLLEFLHQYGVTNIPVWIPPKFTPILFNPLLRLFFDKEENNNPLFLCG